MKVSTDNFNLACRFLAVAWLLTFTPVNQLLRPGYSDFCQYYMAGIVTDAGRWDALYPVPNPGSLGNPGTDENSTAKPEFTWLANALGADRVPFHFIQLPPVALMVLPLAWLDYDGAHFVWLMLGASCAAIVALQAGWIAQRCFNAPTRAAGLLTIVIAFCPLTYRAVRVSNMSPTVAALLGWAILETWRGGDIGAGAAVMLSAVTKYVGAVLAPPLLFMGRWRALAWAAAFAIVLFAITAYFSGLGVFREFVTQIAPTLGRSNDFMDNKSLTAFFIRVTHSNPLSGNVQLFLQFARWLTLLFILFVMSRQARSMRQSPPVYCAACACMIGWMMLFSPICWDHYFIYLMPLWGWLIWEMRNGKARCILACAAIAMNLISTSAYLPFAMPEPWNSHQMASLLIMLGLGISRLLNPPSPIKVTGITP